MLIDLAKVLLLFLGYTLYGSPTNWDFATSLRLSVQFGQTTSCSLEISYDPVAIFESDFSNQRYGGFAFGSFAVIDSSATDRFKRIHLAHELEHIWQIRSYGLLMPATYPFMSSFWEPKPYVYDNLVGMPKSRDLNWSMFKFWASIPCQN